MLAGMLRGLRGEPALPTAVTIAAEVEKFKSAIAMQSAVALLRNARRICALDRVVAMVDRQRRAG
ncbi:hypothetical protein BE08_34130 [Sorangium cellulosum]|uniref:Uncharacterized protein n=1 Tax=Sorangium cellulosum TaxID=56 RepID=A0A150PLJ4_SORCE|nr:hypothetical protein BE08_34130 [Sorangium cellulosum]